MLAKAVIAVAGTPSLSAALQQTLKRVIGAGRGGCGTGIGSGSGHNDLGRGSRDSCSASGVDNLLAAGRLASAISGVDSIEIDEIGSSASG